MNLLDDALVLLALVTYAAVYHAAMSHSSEHESLARAASTVRATSSALHGTVSRHVLPSTVTFKEVHVLHEAAKSIYGKSSNDFLTVIQDELVYSYADRYEKTTNRKRKSEAGVEDEVDKMMRALPDNVNSEQRSKARQVVVHLLRDLKGTQHERLVQSVVISHQKLWSVDAGDPRLVVAVRMASGVPIPVGRLKGALRDCWTDGAITVDDSSELLSSFDLPFSEEGKLATEQLGHKSLRFVTALPREQTNGTSSSSRVPGS